MGDSALDKSVVASTSLPVKYSQFCPSSLFFADSRKHGTWTRMKSVTHLDMWHFLPVVNFFV